MKSNAKKFGDNKFYFGNAVEFIVYRPAIRHAFSVSQTEVKVKVLASVRAKIKNANAYVVSFKFDNRYIDIIKDKYGYPIRQLPLEWGNFNGLVSEIIVPAKELTKIE